MTLATRDDLRLCYVNGDWAWFTTCPLDQQWGDDWNDAPYEHNAGDPYEWHEFGALPRYEIQRVAWHGPFRQPCSDTINSQWSVEGINAGGIPWLFTDEWEPKEIKIYAGTSLVDFVLLVHNGGGEVYFPATSAEAVYNTQQR